MPYIAFQPRTWSGSVGTIECIVCNLSLSLSPTGISLYHLRHEARICSTLYGLNPIKDNTLSKEPLGWVMQRVFNSEGYRTYYMTYHMICDIIGT